MDDNEFLYDAFISYRHLPLDKAVAVRLQELLENYRPPREIGEKRIRRIFRDQSELPTNSDLGADIREALLQSRYLIVICSSETKNSVWCMEEIRQFREAHGERNDHILVILVEGDPHEVFPEELQYEMIPQLQPDGSVRRERRVIEPLSADVRAGSIRQSLKLLRTEFLRVAAPLLGCGFDDLYRRHERRKRKRLATAIGSTAAVFSLVLIIIASFAWRTWLSEQNYQSTLADSYTRQGIASMEDGELQDALLYFASALSLEPEDQTAAAMGAALLLEQNSWLYARQEMSGQIVDGQICAEDTALSTASALAVNADGTLWLESRTDGYVVLGRDGSSLSLGEETWTFLTSASGGDVWVFCSEEDLIFYETASGETSSLPRPTQVNPACGVEVWDTDGLPAASPAADGKIIVVYGGYVYLYDSSEDEEQGDWQPETVVNLEEVFPSDVGDLDIEGYLWVSEDGSLAVVASGFGIAAFDADDLTLRASCLDYHYLLNDVAFSADGDRFALIFGNSFGQAYTSQGGYLAVYSREGELLFQTEEDLDASYQGAQFDPNDPDRLLVWTNTCLELWDLEGEELLAVPVEEDWIAQAAFDEEGSCVTEDGDGNLTVYGIVSFAPAGQPAAQTDEETISAQTGTDDIIAADETAQEEGEDSTPEDGEPEEIDVEGMSQAWQLSEDAIIARTALRVYLLDGSGSSLDEIHLEAAVGEMLVVPEADTVYLYRRYSTVLYMVSLEEDQTAFRDVLTLDTRGRLVQEIYSLDGRIAVVTGSNELLIYTHGETEPDRILALEHGGEVQDVQETAGGCLTVSIRTNLSSTETYHLDMEETVELWDPEAGLHIADLDPAEITLAAQELPAPDEETVSFLLALSCSAFDSAQNLTAQTPTLQADALGTWADALIPETEETGGSETDGDGTEDALLSELLQDESSNPEEESGAVQDLSDLVEACQDGPSDGEEIAWFEECDAIWEKLREGDITFTASSLNRWIYLYLAQAQSHGYLDNIRTGVECYLAINIEYIADEDMMYSWFDYYLMTLMAETDSYDAVIAEGFSAMANALEEALDTEEFGELEEFSYRYQVLWLRCYQNLLSGSGAESFENLETMDQYTAVELYTLKLLVEEQPEEAAELMSNYMQYAAYEGMDSEDILESQTYLQLNYYVLSERETLDPACLNDYLERLPTDSGVRIEELTAEGQQMGLKLGDLIIAADDNYLSCLEQAEDLLMDTGTITLKVVRDGQVLYLEQTGGACYGGSFETAFRDGLTE